MSNLIKSCSFKDLSNHFFESLFFNLSLKNSSNPAKPAMVLPAMATFPSVLILESVSIADSSLLSSEMWDIGDNFSSRRSSTALASSAKNLRSLGSTQSSVIFRLSPYNHLLSWQNYIGMMTSLLSFGLEILSRRSMAVDEVISHEG